MVAELPSPNHLAPCTRRAPLPGKIERNHAVCCFFRGFSSFLFLLSIGTIVTMLSCLWFAFYNKFPDHRSGVKTRLCVAGGPKKTLEEEMEEIGMHEMHEMHGMHGMHCKSDRYQICLEATACYMVIAHGLDHRATSCKRQSSK